MDILKAELSKKRKLLESTSLVSNEKKFFKREELIKKQEEEYWKKQAQKEEERRKVQRETDIGDDSNSQLSGSNEFASEAKSPEEIAKLKLIKFISNQSGPSTSSKSDTQEERILPRKDVIKRLRERNEPIILFGESEIDAFKRLRKLEILEPDASDKGFRNDFQVLIFFVCLFQF